MSAAIQAAKDKERELDKNEFQKRKDQEAQEKKKDEKKAQQLHRIKEREEDKEEIGVDEEEDGFTTIEDNKIKNPNKRAQNWQKQN